MDPVTLAIAKNDAAARYAIKGRVPASPQTASLATYNPISNVYNMKSKHLVRTRAGLARVKAGTGFLKIGTDGDSTTAGWGAVAGTTDWPSQLLQILANAGYPTAGSLIPGYHNISTDTRVTLTSGWSLFGPSTNMVKNTTNTNTVTFTTPACTAVTIYFNNGTPAGTFTVIIDGGSPTTVTPASGVTIGSWTSGALANSTHSIAIASVVGAGQAVYIQGVEARQSTTSGVRLFNVAIGGSTLAQQADTAYFSRGPAIATGYACDLIFLMSEVNDSATNPTTYQTQLQTAITTARASGADVILGTAFPCTLGIVFPGLTTAIYNLADANDLPVVDFGSRWNNDGALINAQGLMFDEKHGNQTGYLDYASHVAKAIL